MLEQEYRRTKVLEEHRDYLIGSVKRLQEERAALKKEAAWQAGKVEALQGRVDVLAAANDKLRKNQRELQARPGWCKYAEECPKSELNLVEQLAEKSELRATILRLREEIKLMSGRTDRIMLECCRMSELVEAAGGVMNAVRAHLGTPFCSSELRRAYKVYQGEPVGQGQPTSCAVD